MSDPLAPWTLERCVNRALTSNRGVLDADVATQSTHYALLAAQAVFELRVFPTATTQISSDENQADAVGAGLTFTQQLRNGTSLRLLPSVRFQDDEFASNLFASIRQPLLRGRQPELIQSGVHAAEYSLRAADRALHRVRVNTVLDTIVGVYRVVEQREFLALTELAQSRAEGHVVAARARERAGLSTSLDVFRATLQAGRAEDALDNARQAYDDALDNLRVLLALPLDTPLNVQAPLAVESIELTEADALSLASSRRIELEQAADDFREALRRARVAEIDAEPDLDLILSLSQGGTGPTLEESLELGSPSLNVSLATTSDLSRTQQRARYEQARLSTQVAQRAQELRRDQVIREVKRSLRGLERGRKRIELQEAQVARAEGSLVVARVKFERGLADNFDVIEAEEQLRSAQLSLISAVTATIVGSYRLRASLGTLLERDPVAG